MFNNTPFGSNTGLGFNNSTTSTFGQPSTSAFGGAPSAFGGSVSTPFGGNTFGGAPSAPFGGGTSSFGGTTSTFGQANPSPFGGATNSTFGTSTGTGLFSNNAPSAFGSSTTTQSPFGGTTGSGLFGNTSTTSAFGANTQQSGGLFGNTGSTFGGTGATGFGSAAPTGGLFGNTGSSFGGNTFPVPNGTGNPPYKPTQDSDSGQNGTTVNVMQTCITAMPQYAMKSLEELRWDDYQMKKHLQGGSGLTSAFGSNTSNTSLFGGGGSTFGGSMTGGSTFGGNMTGGLTATATSPSLFGSTNSTFGAKPTGTSLFGNTAAPSTGVFGATPSAFGTSTGTSLFGGTQTAPSNPSPFGSTSTGTSLFGGGSAPSAFGSTSTGSSFFGGSSLGGTGTNPSPFGGTTSLFGNPAPSTTSLFGAPATSPFGASSGGGSLFGNTTAPAPSTGGLFGNSAPSTGSSLFGNTQQPSTGGLFGASSSATGGSLFGNSAPSSTGGLFGNTATQPAPSLTGFGTSTGSSLFGGSTAPSTGLFGAAPTAPAPSLFGGSLPSTGSSLFGGASTQTPSLFGNTTSGSSSALGGSLFGNSQPSSSLFGNQQAVAQKPPIVGANPNPHGELPQVQVTPVSPAPTTESATQQTPALNSNVLKSLKWTPVGMSSVYRLTPKSTTKTNTRVSTSAVISRPLFEEQEVSKDISFLGSSQKTLPSTPGPLVSRQSLNSKVLRLEDEEVTISSLKPKENSAQEVIATPQGFKKSEEKLPNKPPLYTVPNLASIGNKKSVFDFTVGCEGYGYVKFLKPVDLTGVTMEDINAIFVFNYGEVIVYPDERTKKVPEGQGFNLPAQVTLEGVFPRDKKTRQPKTDEESLSRWQTQLKATTEDLGAKFIAFVAETGDWVFEVQHFSRYGLKQEDDDEEMPVPRGIPRPVVSQPKKTPSVPAKQQLHFPSPISLKNQIPSEELVEEDEVVPVVDTYYDDQVDQVLN